MKHLLESWREYLHEDEKEKEEYEPHMMYDPESGESEKAETYERHKELKDRGWGHEKPEVDEAKKKGLWANIAAKKKRMKAGSGEKKAKPGDEDYPETLDVDEAKEKGVDGKECWKGYKHAGSEDTDGDGKPDKDKCVKSESVTPDMLVAAAKWADEHGGEMSKDADGNAVIAVSPDTPLSLKAAQEVKEAGWEVQMKGQFVLIYPAGATSEIKENRSPLENNFKSAVMDFIIEQMQTMGMNAGDPQDRERIKNQVMSIVGTAIQAIGLNEGARMNESYSEFLSEEALSSFIDEFFIKEETDKERMKCNSPRYIKEGEPGYGKKQKVVKACKDGKEKIIRFGDANMENKSDSADNKSNFRSRHNCDEKKDKFSAGYWSCKDW
tara:strand:- start:403 stop:1548 length:1146 start_codon:yes stop_codon:yes gene_type:complete